MVGEIADDRIWFEFNPMKHLIICLDGTWSDGNAPAPQTNIAVLAGIIDPNPAGAPEQRVYYDAGVGTGGLIDRIAGGMFGKGLSANVLAAYRFLCQFYEPGDRIYVFGYSRGAFTARSLCGFMSASGLLTQDMCNAANQEFAWSYYRTPPKQRFPADRARLKRITHPDPRVRFLGVFDTVGALGIPKSFMSRIGKRSLQFHDADVSSIVDHSCHALAIDEYRLEFEASVWTEPRHRKYQSVEQAWFPGSHSNIGGGYDDTGLSDLALDWILKRLQHHCPELKLNPADAWPRQLRPDYRGKLYDERSWMFWRSRWRPLVRLINRCEIGRARLLPPAADPAALPSDRRDGALERAGPLGGDQGQSPLAALSAAQPPRRNQERAGERHAGRGRRRRADLARRSLRGQRRCCRAAARA